MATLDGIVDGPWIDYTKSTSGLDFDGLMTQGDTRLAELQDISDALSKGETVGGVLNFPVGDGMATYVVTKAHPLTLKWVPHGDQWQVPDYTIRGLRKADILGMIAFEQCWKEL